RPTQATCAPALLRNRPLARCRHNLGPRSSPMACPLRIDLVAPRCRCELSPGLGQSVSDRPASQVHARECWALSRSVQRFQLEGELATAGPSQVFARSRGGCPPSLRQERSQGTVFLSCEKRSNRTAQQGSAALADARIWLRRSRRR